MNALGDIALVWTAMSLALAAVTGFAFGYLVIGSILAQEKWRSPNAPLTIAWLAFVLCFGWIMLIDFGQALAAIFDGDPFWPRVLSRLGPHIVAAVFTGIGIPAGMGRARTGGLPERFLEWWRRRGGK